MLKSSGVGATPPCTARCIRLTSQVPHRVRRLTGYPQQDPQRAAQRLCARHAYGISTSADSVPLQQSQQLDNGPNTSLLADELQKQWHAQLNMHLGHNVIRPASKRKVRWSCEQCPDGFSHILQATFTSRTYGAGCPFCSGKGCLSEQHACLKGT
ncbi:TPA: hypothetical protein ACH3X2_001342 [Trebouxia sp. C0005]